MNEKTSAQFEAQAHILKALAHPTRLFIIHELSENERCVCELTALIGADISTVSKHLSQLKNAGIVCDEKRGSKIYYCLRTRCVLNFFTCVESVQKTVLQEQMRLIT